MTTSVLLAVLAGLMAGLVHALSGPDHLSAVAPLTLQERRGTWRPGLFWGAGHSLGVWGVGAFALLLRDFLPVERLSSWSERLVGAVLIAVGLWGLRKAFLFRLPRPTTEAIEHHAAAHGLRADRPGWAAFGVGTLHGLAGSAHIVGLFPALALVSRAESVGYVVAFGLGTVAAMVAFSSTLGLFAARVTRIGRPAYQALLATTSVVAIAVGGYWLTL
jgi:sulfite exporter TauE/SafE